MKTIRGKAKQKTKVNVVGRPQRFKDGLVRQELRLRPETKTGIKAMALAKKMRTGKTISTSSFIDEVLHSYIVKSGYGKKGILKKGVKKNVTKFKI